MDVSGGVPGGFFEVFLGGAGDSFLAFLETEVRGLALRSFG